MNCTLSLLLVMSLALGGGGCSPSNPSAAGADAAPDSATSAEGGDAPASADSCVTAGANAGSVDCLLGGPCAPVVIGGDSPDPPGSTNTYFHGYADPCIRKDPSSGGLWLAYTYTSEQPSLGLDGGTISISAAANHLARSTDQGTTWTEVGTSLWAAIAQGDPAGGATSGYYASEVANILPVATASGTVWYSAHIRYFDLPEPGYHPKLTSFTLRLSMANAPSDFTTQDPALELVLGTGNTDPVYKAKNLNALDPSLAVCTLWNEPALYFANGKLYLAAECQATDPTKEQIAVFSFVTSGAPATWTPVYAGALSNGTIASELGTQLGLSPPVTELMQTELAVGTDGKLLALLTPSHIDSSKTGVGAEVHAGCRAIELASIDPPTLARDCDGHLLLRATVTASDEADGTSSCGYEPTSVTGILLARRPGGGTTNGVVDGFSVNASGLLP